MTMEVISQYFTNYGAIAIFVIVFLEYLNLPGFPAGVIMPLAGIWAAQGKIPVGRAKGSISTSRSELLRIVSRFWYPTYEVRP